METTYTYHGSDRPIKVGDHVMVKVHRFLLGDRWVPGVVTHVNDPNVPWTLARERCGQTDPVIYVDTYDGAFRPFGPPPFTDVKLVTTR